MNKLVEEEELPRMEWALSPSLKAVTFQSSRKNQKQLTTNNDKEEDAITPQPQAALSVRCAHFFCCDKIHGQQREASDDTEAN